MNCVQNSQILKSSATYGLNHFSESFANNHNIAFLKKKDVTVFPIHIGNWKRGLKKGTYFLAIFPCQIVKFTKFSVKQSKRISNSHVLFSCFMLLKHKENIDNRSQASRFNKFIHFPAGWKREKSWVSFCWKILIRISWSKTEFFVSGIQTRIVNPESPRFGWIPLIEYKSGFLRFTV